MTIGDVCMSKKLSRIIAAVMFILAIAFLAFALAHPNASFTWSNAVTYAIYAVYILAMTVLFIAPFKREK